MVPKHLSIVASRIRTQQERKLLADQALHTGNSNKSDPFQLIVYSQRAAVLAWLDLATS